jgi:DNA-directed RNA polymerase subunit K/omega
MLGPITKKTIAARRARLVAEEANSGFEPITSEQKNIGLKP